MFWTIATQQEDLSKEVVGETLDLDNFSRQVFSWVFIGLITEVFNHKLTAEFLEERVSFYEAMMAQFGQPNESYIATLRSYMDNRADFTLAEAQEPFSLNGPFRVSLENPDGLDLLVDGYHYSSSYEGHCFESTSLHVKPASDTRQRFSHWLINGEKVLSEDLDLVIEDDPEIELMPEPAS
jgi:hypothetical protein